MANGRFSFPTRIGNWYEDTIHEDYKMATFVDQREKGELASQRLFNWRAQLHSEVRLSVSKMGGLNFGDVIMLVNVGCEPDHTGSKMLRFPATAVSLNISFEDLQTDRISRENLDATASEVIESNGRTALIISPVDGAKDGDQLRFNQPFTLKTNSGGFLMKCVGSTMKGLNCVHENYPIYFSTEFSHLNVWQVLPFNPNLRMELERSPVPANKIVVIKHLKSGQNLTMEPNKRKLTYFGVERGLAAYTRRNQYRLDYEESQWIFMMHSPGSDVLPLQSLQLSRQGAYLAKEACLKDRPCEDVSGECAVVDPDCHQGELEFLDPIQERCAPLDEEHPQKTGIYVENNQRK